ncbi:probable ATP-dependent RNA helicase DDX52 isoform X2 [Orbicella faveolata]|uniref:probable ATP-dependent RNA helicase DDX52 isoform X2 n=1 Tax=Orbicella faveolata TaxID=48498 RepID=UPI0009E53C99|nr:probable ATP-dependent RNA helicase DDX52 isoform X2 [Orbicella faveolata]
MVDTFDLFRRLSVGAKFNKKKFHNDTENVKDSNECVFHSENVAQALDFFGTLGEPGDSLDRTSKAEKSKGTSKDLLDSGNRTKNKKSEEESSEFRGKRKKRKRVTTKDENGNGSIPLPDSKVKIFAEQTSGNVSVDKKFSSERMTELHQEKMNIARRENHIYVKGSDIPDLAESFSDLQERLAPYMIENVTKRGYQQPTPIQMQAIPLIIHKREVLCCAPTGSGKTAAFILPILHHLKSSRKEGFRAVVVSPTRELAQQIYHEFCHLSNGRMFRIHLLTKSKASSNSFGSKSSQKFDILVTTPNRLVHLLSQDPPGIQLHNVEWLILDEADKLFEEGKDGFREQVATIYQACDKPDVKRALFSATLSNGIDDWARIHLDNVVKVTVGIRNTATHSVEQELLFVGQEAGKLLAVRDIVQKGFQPPMLIFVQSKERAKELFHELIYDGINVDVIHSDRTQAQRDNVVKCFRTGKIWVLIATELMGRGIDFKGVNLVINYDFPTSSVAYIHRIGRTGRAGRPGKAVTFFTEDDATNLRSIANVMKSSGCEIPDWMLKLKKPGRKSRKKLSKTPPLRSAIKTVSKYDSQKAKRKRELIEASKKKKKKMKLSSSHASERDT